MFCPSCGTEPDTANFCMKCGLALTAAATPRTGEPRWEFKDVTVPTGSYWIAFKRKAKIVGTQRALLTSTRWLPLTELRHTRRLEEEFLAGVMSRSRIP